MNVRRALVALTAGGAIAVVLACSPSPHTTGSTLSVTLVGCVQPGDAPDTYRLANTAAPSGSVGTRGTEAMLGQGNATGTASQSHTSDAGVADTRLYTLVAERNVDLAQYQGAVVKVTGYVERGKDANGGSTAQDRSPAPGGQGGTPADNARHGQQGEAGPPNQVSAHPTTGQGPQSSVYGPSRDRPEQTVHVNSVTRVAPDCATSK